MSGIENIKNSLLSKSHFGKVLWVFLCLVVLLFKS